MAAAAAAPQAEEVSTSTNNEVMSVFYSLGVRPYLVAPGSASQHLQQTVASMEPLYFRGPHNIDIKPHSKIRVMHTFNLLPLLSHLCSQRQTRSSPIWQLCQTLFRMAMMYQLMNMLKGGSIFGGSGGSPAAQQNIPGSGVVGPIYKYVPSIYLFCNTNILNNLPFLCVYKQSISVCMAVD